ncbi:hypothetical protein [Mucilaginibacter sp.]|uniref:hypothetical protein n=1 Tax=Mucilaginibacter sp. TaxID=1882438 RepID=UPI0025D3EDB3|nr:hypothetical protein [Mucilaginibacter sp.]
MYKILCTTMLIALISIQANAQTGKFNLDRHLYPGSITKTDGQVIKGYIFNQGKEANQRECLFYTDADDLRTKIVFKPADLVGYSIENFQYKSMNYSGNIGFGKNGRNFLLVLKPGAIGEYIYYLGEEQVVLQKGDEEPVSNASLFLGFRKSMLKLVGDDTELAGKIDRKEKGYGLTSLDAIVDEYNKWAASKK